jgi:hypothetical protein
MIELSFDDILSLFMYALHTYNTRILASIRNNELVDKTLLMAKESLTNILYDRYFCATLVGNYDDEIIAFSRIIGKKGINNSILKNIISTLYTDTLLCFETLEDI